MNHSLSEEVTDLKYTNWTEFRREVDLLFSSNNPISQENILVDEERIENDKTCSDETNQNRPKALLDSRFFSPIESVIAYWEDRKQRRQAVEMKVKT